MWLAPFILPVRGVVESPRPRSCRAERKRSASETPKQLA